MSENPETPNEEVAAPEAVTQATPKTVKDFAGFEEGEVLADGSIVKGDYDDTGNVIGWHKEAPAGEGVEV